LGAARQIYLKVPDGLEFSEFKGYDAWQTIAVSEPEGSVKGRFWERVERRSCGGLHQSIYAQHDGDKPAGSSALISG